MTPRRHTDERDRPVRRSPIVAHQTEAIAALTVLLRHMGRTPWVLGIWEPGLGNRCNHAKNCGK